MSDPVARSKRMVRQAVLRQMLTVAALAVAAAAVAPQGMRFALGVLAGGMAVALGGLLASRIALGPGVAPANVVLLRWIAGVVVRWGVFLGVMVGAAAVWKLPPAALLLGVLAALVAYVVTVSMQSARNSNP